MINMLLADRYECLQKIGSGGMGDVYKAHDRRLDRIVAIKVLKSEYNQDDNFIRKFRRESLAAASISHPNIVSIYDVGVEEIENSNLYYIVMEYIDGKTLKDLVREEGMISQNQALNYLIQISEALKVAHSKNIVHRDIKSQNIMVTKDNRIKVTDFGIARMAGNSTVTVTNAVMGSVHYFSPEQARGQKVDARSDIYSMGIVLFEMLTGDVPFDSENPITVALMHVQNPIPIPSERNPRVSNNVDQIFKYMTQKKPQDRYDNVSQIIEDVKNILLNKVAPVNNTTHTTIPVDKGNLMAGAIATETLNKKKVSPNSNIRENKSLEKKKKKEGNKVAGMIGGFLALLLILFLVFGLPKMKGFFDNQEEASLVIMENFVGKSLEEAEIFAEGNGLEIEIAGKEINDEVAPNTILSQSIEENSKLKLGDKFSVVVSEKTETVEVPKLTNMSVTEAQNTLKNLGIELSVDRAEYSTSVPKDRIISQDPKAGSEIELNSTVYVVISQGAETKLTLVPNLKGVTLEKAKALLEEQGLQIGAVDEKEDSSVGKGDVVWQQYESGDKVEVGTKVDIIISSGLPGATLPITEEDSESNNNENNAEEKTKNLNLTIELSDDGLSHNVQVVKKSKSGEEVVNSFTALGGKKEHISVTGIVGDQFDIYVDGTKMKSETVR